MSINHIGPEEIARRKVVSDESNDTESLTFSSNEKISSRGNAYRKVRDIKDEQLINSLMNHNDKLYFESLLD